MRKKSQFAIGLLAAGALLVSGCGLLNNKTAAPSANPAGDMKANLYVVDKNGVVVPLASNLPKNAGPAGEALNYLVQGGDGEQLLRGTGLYTVLPKGTKAQLNINNGLATVDLSKDVLNYKSLKDEQDIVQSIVWTLTEYPTIKQVQFQIGGQVRPTLPFGTPIGSPISRDSGINLQVAPGTNPSDSSRVTVYLIDQVEGGKSYLVPVTRVIPKVDQTDLVKTTLAQMSVINGVSSLKQTLSSPDVFGSSEVKDNVVHVDLKSGVFPAGSTPSAQADILKSIWMSVSTNLHVSKVQLTVQGKSVQVVSDKIDWTKPVSDLRYINQQPDKAI